MPNAATEQTVFTPPQAETAPVVTQPVSQPSFTIPQEASELVGSGKKYNTVEDALRSVPHAQNHISTLENELATIKSELEKRKTTEQLLEEIRSTGLPTSAATPAPTGLDPNVIQQMITQTLSATEAKRSADVNVNTVISTFTQKYGDKAEEFFINLAKETGLSVKNLNDLSATSPSAVLKLAGLDAKQTPHVVAKPNGSINTEVFNSNNTNQGNEQSARVRQGASTKDLVAAWKNAGKTVGKT